MFGFLTQPVAKRWATSTVNSALKVGAGYLMAQGLADANTLNPEFLSGLATAIVGLGWSLYEKRWKPRLAQYQAQSQVRIP